ncbi:hypothetical protein FVE67_04810 [Thermosulfurimonas marina]|uniref:Uncharacterized protein n=1 Tax=Thermosulfurimonas marina TaxID=2047767 RepID=A0A6H1WSL0_9BACT|nr:DUF6657 family protein [Thermosulfurimonas marina]QJA06160.1 hypothetical protein FVE67_04810 [Thermosulfurimonas marina]
MGEIKSALEIALEKAEKIGKASKEELRAQELREKGQRLAARYLSPEGEVDLAAEIAKLSPEERLPVVRGVVETLLRNIVLPRDEMALKDCQKALQGLEAVFSAFPEIKNLTREIEKLLQQYLNHREALYQQLKQQFETQLAGVEEALSNQMGVKVKVEVEMHPQFQEEWRKVRDQLDPQYQRQLDYLKGIFERALSG